MKHVKTLSRSIPRTAMSVVEIDGMFQKIGRMFTTISGLFSAAMAGMNFWNSVNKE